MFRLAYCVLVLAAVAPLLTGVPAYATVIDDFEVGQLNVHQLNPPHIVGVMEDAIVDLDHVGELLPGLPANNVAAGRRGVSVRLQTGASISAQNFPDGPGGSDDGILFQYAPNSYGEGMLIYTFASPLDLTATGHDRFVVNSADAPPPGGALFFYLEDFDGDSDEQVLPTAGPGNYEFPFGDFVAAEPNLDLNDINWVILRVYPVTDPILPGRFQINDIRTTPEPATLTLLALGGLAVFRKRRKQ
jgi:hypothetical protein